MRWPWSRAMRWPWSRARKAELDRKLAEAESAKQFADQLAAESRKVRTQLSAEVKRNHFGEMLQEAMVRRFNQ